MVMRLISGEGPVEDFGRGERELELLYNVIEGQFKRKTKSQKIKSVFCT